MFFFWFKFFFLSAIPPLLSHFFRVWMFHTISNWKMIKLFSKGFLVPAALKFCLRLYISKWVA